jgi:pimeloyl-ACP methyl ester carboxylesterase
VRSSDRAVVVERDVVLPDGRVLHVYDTHPDDDERAVIVWHHGTPNMGPPPEPLTPILDRLGGRFIGFDRPGYGGSTPDPERTIRATATNVVHVLDALGIENFRVMGHSGGGPHALACAALLPDRVLGAVTISAPAPFNTDGLDWFAGMAPAGVAQNRAAAQGRQTLESHSDDDDFGFTPEDERALQGRWAWFLDVVRPALATGSAGRVDDLLASVRPWGFDLETIGTPVLLLHGDADRVVPITHARWLSTRVPNAHLVERPGDGHITVMDGAPDALVWLLHH